MEDGKDIVRQSEIEEKIVEEFNQFFVPEGDEFSLTYPKKLTYEPGSDKRFKGLPTSKLLELVDIVGEIQHKLYSSVTFNNDNVWTPYVSRISSQFNKLISDRGISESLLGDYKNRRRNRIKLWADSQLSINEFNNIVTKINIPFGETWDRDPDIRRANLYLFEAKRLDDIKTKKNETDLTKLKLMDSVYDSYRGGKEKDKSQIREFDAYIRSLWMDDVFSFKNDGRVILPKDHPSENQKKLLLRCKEISDSWGTGNDEDNQMRFVEEVRSSLERIYIHRTLINDQSESRLKFVNIFYNPGYRLGLGLVLTEKTRKYLFESGDIKRALRERARALHSDITGNNEYDDLFKLANAANKVLSSSENFRKWLAGKKLFEI